MDNSKYSDEDYFIIHIIADAVVFCSMRKQLTETSEMITGIPAQLDKFPYACLTVLWYFSKKYDKNYSDVSDEYADQLIDAFWTYEDEFDLNTCIKNNSELSIAEKIFLEWKEILKTVVSDPSNNIKQTAV